MKIILLLIATVVGLSACQTTQTSDNSEQAYSPYNSELTHTTYLGPAPSIRSPLVEKTK
jgi:uncharacterized protein YceK